MSTQSEQHIIEQRINSLHTHLNTIDQHLDKVLTENKRLRGIVRLAESELRKRRDRTEVLEQKLKAYEDAQDKASSPSEAVAEEHHDNT